MSPFGDRFPRSLIRPIFSLVLACQIGAKNPLVQPRQRMSGLHIFHTMVVLGMQKGYVARIVRETLHAHAPNRIVTDLFKTCVAWVMRFLVGIIPPRIVAADQ